MKGSNSPIVLVATLAIGLVASNLAAQTGDLTSWQNLRSLAPGRPIEVINRKGESLNGNLASVSEESIAVVRKRDTVATPRTEVLRVRLRSNKQRKYTLIGTAIGAGAGAGLGAAAGESLAYNSGGDFANLKPAVIVLSCALGALAGAIAGSVAGNRHTTVYRAK